MGKSRFARLKTLALPLMVVLAVCTLVGWAAHSPVDWRQIDTASTLSGPSPTLERGLPLSEIAETVHNVDRYFESAWKESGRTAAPPAEDLQVFRRLTLALCGTIPSLEEIRIFESNKSPDRLDQWTRRLLADSRFADYFAERLARSFVGNEAGQFIVFRRDRFSDWLRQQLSKNTPYDQMTREMISGTGLWTDHPATNYVTAAIANGELDENKLAGRTVRAFLGQRIDCAQCHDHPFAEWKQGQFQGLASLFGQTQNSLVGIEDKAQKKYEVEDRKTLKKHVVEPAVPFHPEWLPGTGTRRERLAAWITHPDSRRFERATANRIWGLMFGKPFHSPVDDLPDPQADADPNVLDLLGADFRAHHCDLRRMIRVIAASRPYRLDSVADESVAEAKPVASKPAAHSKSTGAPAGDWNKADNNSTQAKGAADSPDAVADWVSFPLTRLRPEQLIGAMLQARSVRTIDQNSHLFVRATRFFQENDFVKEYGDLGENELDDRTGTISQALLRMNGKLSDDALKADPLNASTRLGSFAESDATCLEGCYLVVLSRRPSKAESDYFLAQLASAGSKGRSQVVEDIFWSLFNSPEFSWNH
ncbi:MAG TPA: DUF1549 domain-containing protein [Planctomycetaceae bacterium]|nr:DUF1549 domain-containing protein [Planctomycetaceae bacterium]